MKKRSNYKYPAFTTRILVFQQQKVIMRLREISKYKNGKRERRFCLAVANC